MLAASGVERWNPGVADARGRVLQSVLELLAANDIPYCILHGYESYPARVASDVDCVMESALLPQRLGALLRANRRHLGADLVQWIQHESTAHYFVLATEDGPRWQFLSLDVSSDYRRNGRVFYEGHEILSSRRPHRDCWVPAPPIEFGCYLVKKIAKGALGEEHGERLTALYRRDPSGAERAVTRFWRGRHADVIITAAASGRWGAVQRRMPAIRSDLLWPGTLREAWSCGRYWTAEVGRRVRRWRAPTGAHVVLLGADGSGKSTVVQALSAALAPAFRRVTALHLAPALFRYRRAGRTVSAPHGQRPRSLPGSLAKAVYWLLDYSLGYYVRVRSALARSTLVLFDRYLLDALADPRRYRYGGPPRLLPLIWRLVPKPDLVILLDAPTDVLRSRKQEVAVAETERVTGAYRRIVMTSGIGHIVDAAQPVDGVVRAAGAVILDFLRARVGRRLEGQST